MKNLKTVITKDYKYIFNKKTGFFARWGQTTEDNPQFSPFGPEILDIEISTICHQGCSWCYKSNTSKGKNMSLDTFKNILSVIPPNLTQIAFGIGSIDANPDLAAIMRHTRDEGFIPNITINGARMTDQYYTMLASLCGAVAVSNYGKDQCYNTVQKLNEYKQITKDATLQQVNIHQLLAEETLDTCWELMSDMKNDKRLKDLNAVVFLLLKPKGKRNSFHQLKNASHYKDMVSYALDNGLSIGFDSCSAPSFLRAVEGRPDYEHLKQCAEPCESTCFSLYVDVDGKAWPCSFCEEVDGIKSIDLMKVSNFMSDVWKSEELSTFRDKLIQSHCSTGCRECPVYNIEINKES